jgi:hypothetical protein
MLDDLAMQSVIVAPGLMIAEHSFDVPLDHDREDDRQIKIFAQEVADPDGRDRPFLVYFQGASSKRAQCVGRGASKPGPGSRTSVSTMA